MSNLLLLLPFPFIYPLFKTSFFKYFFQHGERKVPHFPIPQFRPYSTFLEPNQGVLNPVYARALVLNDGNVSVCFVTFDLMAVDEPMTYLAWLMAAAKGFPVPFERCTFTRSHTHSSYGAWMSQFAIQITPTMYVSLFFSLNSSFFIHFSLLFFFSVSQFFSGSCLFLLCKRQLPLQLRKP